MTTAPGMPVDTHADEQAQDAEAYPGPFLRVCYFPDLHGESYDAAAQFAFLPAQEAYTPGVVERLFTEVTGLPSSCIAHYVPDHLYDADGERMASAPAHPEATVIKP